MLCVSSLIFVCFFFSSRRRHTRYIGDWSSDVCSSDLIGGVPYIAQILNSVPSAAHGAHYASIVREKRSEERRVGKECRSRGAAYHEKKKGKSRRQRGPGKIRRTIRSGHQRRADVVRRM